MPLPGPEPAVRADFSGDFVFPEAGILLRGNRIAAARNGGIPEEGRFFCRGGYHGAPAQFFERGRLFVPPCGLPTDSWNPPIDKTPAVCSMRS